jgi:multidrug efflux system membrane fusion protein
MRNNFNILSTGGIAMILVFALGLTASCRQKEQKAMGMPAMPVTIGTAEKKDVPVQISAIGSVEAFATVAVKTQAGGTLIKVHFTEGQEVKKGDLLFTIDPRPYEAALKQAEANLARSRAQRDNAHAEELRYAELAKKGYVSQTQYEQAITNFDALEATVQADAAMLENAKLNLAFCTIRSPLNGRTGSLSVHEGNLVKANADSPMVTILRIQPVQVVFTVPEKNLPDIKKHMAVGALKVEAYLSKEERAPAIGRLSFIDNTVDTLTGTIKLKATFENSDRRLWPGQFVSVVMTISLEKNATVVPAGAVQTGQQGQFVFVVRPDHTAEMRPVSTGRSFEDFVVMEKGLVPGEHVVTDGQMRLVPGAKVEVKDGQGSKVEGQKEQAKPGSAAKD